jgi:simple sugar transport system permease protein
MLWWLLGEQFFSLNNFQSMGYQIPEFGFLALAMAVTMITGGIDLSVVANANLSGILAAFILTRRFDFLANFSEPTIVVMACVLALFVASMAGLFNGLLISKLSVPPILATLGTMTLFNGISMAITSGEGVVGFPEMFLSIGSSAVANIPLIFILFILASIVVGFMLERTTTGFGVYLYGENRIAALFAGLRTENLIIRVYFLSGLLAGFASIIMISRFNSAKVGYGDTYLLQAILVSVLGGIAPEGGRGRIVGVVLGIFILQALQSAFTFFAFTPYAKKLIWGSMLLLVMVINFVIEWWRARSRRFVIEQEPATSSSELLA